MLEVENKNNKVSERVYLDHAATTPVDPRVMKTMEPFLSENFGNAGGLYEEGRRAKESLQNSREIIAKLIGAKPDEIIFTSGGTEADNLAIFGVARAAGLKGHIITTAFEHHAVLLPAQELSRDGFDVSYLPVGEEGIINPEDVGRALRSDTVLVSIMHANNEIGTIQPIAQISKIIKKHREENKTSYPYFHADACQSAGYLNLNVNSMSGGLGVDLMSVNGGKIYGPKGVGFLYKRSGTRMRPIIFGGGQEGRMRSGTEATPLIAGLARAFEIAQSEREAESKRLIEIRDYFISRLLKEIPKTVLNGHQTNRLPNNVNVSILDIEGEALVLYLDAEGISFSTGSACTSESLDPSHVILALGKPYEFAHSSMRFTLGRSTTKADIDYVMEKLPKTVEWLRKVSPISVDMDAKSMSHPEAFAGEGLRVKAKSKSYK